ncbi:lytic murein transglycosylase [Pseudorhodobacter sp. E13]|uniref:lytic murein transglycosylase n=1 Tax=Pseudorhodobacter sp. E13 TaxID=2487931 RepID=UPI000F8C8E12|nr:lytic murein transglycosylase [Pseudorhodobacter sp. E13]
MQFFHPVIAWCFGTAAALAAPVDQPARFIGKTGAVMVQETVAADTQGLQRWLAGFRTRAAAAGISDAVMDQALRGLSYDADVVRRDRNQSEFTKTIWDYLDTATSDARVENGKAALAKHRRVLQAIEDRYGVEKEIVAAIWGLESAYGTFRGSVPTIQSLATLAYDGRRAAFFEGELLAALKILQSGDTTAPRMQGSWAGAMGHTQFMPSSYLAYAVDFDGDGKRNIWEDDPTDALASTASYLAGFGWTKGALWGMEITLPQGFDYDQTSERVKKPVADWQAMGVRRVDGGDLPDHGTASVLLPGGARGAAFLIYSNFQVIERYNTADAYVIAVGHLADLLKGGPRIASDWPRDLRALTLDERLDLQTRLTRAGFDTKGVDGKMGPNTIAAVKAFQRASGLVPDGYPSLEILQKLP